MIEIPVGRFFEVIIQWMIDNWSGFFDAITTSVSATLNTFETMLMYPHPLIMIGLFTALAWYISGRGVAAFTAIGLFLIEGMNLWPETMDTLALIATAVIIALIIGIPVGIWA